MEFAGCIYDKPVLAASEKRNFLFQDGKKYPFDLTADELRHGASGVAAVVKFTAFGRTTIIGWDTLILPGLRIRMVKNRGSQLVAESSYWVS